MIIFQINVNKYFILNSYKLAIAFRLPIVKVLLATDYLQKEIELEKSPSISYRTML